MLINMYIKKVKKKKIERFEFQKSENLPLIEFPLAKKLIIYFLK